MFYFLQEHNGASLHKVLIRPKGPEKDNSKFQMLLSQSGGQKGHKSSGRGKSIAHHSVLNPWAQRQIEGEDCRNNI